MAARRTPRRGVRSDVRSPLRQQRAEMEYGGVPVRDWTKAELHDILSSTVEMAYPNRCYIERCQRVPSPFNISKEEYVAIFISDMAALEARTPAAVWRGHEEDWRHERERRTRGDADRTREDGDADALVQGGTSTRQDEEMGFRSTGLPTRLEEERIRSGVDAARAQVLLRQHHRERDRHERPMRIPLGGAEQTTRDHRDSPSLDNSSRAIDQGDRDGDNFSNGRARAREGLTREPELNQASTTPYSTAVGRVGRDQRRAPGRFTPYRDGGHSRSSGEPAPNMGGAERSPRRAMARDLGDGHHSNARVIRHEHDNRVNLVGSASLTLTGNINFLPSQPRGIYGGQQANPDSSDDALVHDRRVSFVSPADERGALRRPRMASPLHVAVHRQRSIGPGLSGNYDGTEPQNRHPVQSQVPSVHAHVFYGNRNGPRDQNTSRPTSPRRSHRTPVDYFRGSTRSYNGVRPPATADAVHRSRPGDRRDGDSDNAGDGGSGIVVDGETTTPPYNISRHRRESFRDLYGESRNGRRRVRRRRHRSPSQDRARRGRARVENSSPTSSRRHDNEGLGDLPMDALNTARPELDGGRDPEPNGRRSSYRRGVRSTRAGHVSGNNFPASRNLRTRRHRQRRVNTSSDDSSSAERRPPSPDLESRSFLRSRSRSPSSGDYQPGSLLGRRQTRRGSGGGGSAYGGNWPSSGTGAPTTGYRGNRSRTPPGTTRRHNGRSSNPDVVAGTLQRRRHNHTASPPFDGREVRRGSRGYVSENGWNSSPSGTGTPSSRSVDDLSRTSPVPTQRREVDSSEDVTSGSEAGTAASRSLNDRSQTTPVTTQRSDNERFPPASSGTEGLQRDGDNSTATSAEEYFASSEMARALKIRLRELRRQARAGTLEMQFQQGLVILADVVLAFAPEGTALLQVLRWAHWSRSSYYRWKNLGEELVKVGAVTDLLQCNSRVSAFAPPARFAGFGGVPHTIRGTRFLHVTDGINPCVCVDRVHGGSDDRAQNVPNLEEQGRREGRNESSERAASATRPDQMAHVGIPVCCPLCVELTSPLDIFRHRCGILEHLMCITCAARHWRSCIVRYTNPRCRSELSCPYCREIMPLDSEIVGRFSTIAPLPHRHVGGGVVVVGDSQANPLDLTA